MKKLTDCTKPDVMVIEAMMDESIIREHDDGKNGVWDYLKKVAEILCYQMRGASESVRRATKKS